MRYTTKRSYAVTHHKKNPEPERSIDFSLASAAGILVFTLATGFLIGICYKKMYK